MDTENINIQNIKTEAKGWTELDDYLKGMCSVETRLHGRQWTLLGPNDLHMSTISARGVCGEFLSFIFMLISLFCKRWKSANHKFDNCFSLDLGRLNYSRDSAFPYEEFPLKSSLF